MCFKVWEEITIPTFAKHPRYGVRAGQPNPRFLDAKLFEELVLTPYREAKFEPHTSVFLFEFQRHGMPAEEFCSGLDQFFVMLPCDFRYAVEAWNPGLQCNQAINNNVVRPEGLEPPTPRSVVLTDEEDTLP